MGVKEDREKIADRAILAAEHSVIKLEVGKKYRNRNGDVHGPMKITASYPDRFTDELGNWYGADGHYWAQRPDCPFSLIAHAALVDDK